MAGKTPVLAAGVQKRALADLARSREWGEADRARAILLILWGRTSPDMLGPCVAGAKPL